MTQFETFTQFLFKHYRIPDIALIDECDILLDMLPNKRFERHGKRAGFCALQDLLRNPKDICVVCNCGDSVQNFNSALMLLRLFVIIHSDQ